MNSSELKKNHSKIYERFFVDNTLIVSSPFLINRSGDLHPKFSGVSIKQKIPLRLYVGIQKNTSGKVVLGSILTYNSGTDSFEGNELSKDIFHTDALILEIQKRVPQEYTGITINILSEIPKTLGMGYNSILPLCLSAIIMIIQDKKILTDISSLPSAPIQKSLDNNDTIKKLLYIAMELDPIIHGKMTSAMKISSFFDGYYPIVAFRDRTEHTLSDKELSLVKLYSARIDEMRNNLEGIEFPFEFGVIVSDRPILRENFKNVNWTSSVSASDKTIIKTLIDNVMKGEKSISFNNFPKFYDFLGSDFDAIHDTYGAMMGAISIETLNIFGKIFSSHYSDELFNTFFYTINKIRYGNNILRKLSPHFAEFIDALLTSINLSSYEFACFPNNTLVREGTLTYVSYSEKNREQIIRGILKTKSQYPGAYLLYSNAIDGIEKRGFILEQYIDEGIFSIYTSNSLRELKDDLGNRIIGNFEYLINKKDYDIILDTFNNKIYHKGIKLNSQSISSQSTTIDLLRLLFSSPNKEISNSDMQYSSYSKNKNELNSKIIAPLEKRTKEHTDKECIIKASGSLTNFSVYVKHSSLKIGYLSKKV